MNPWYGEGFFGSGKLALPEWFRAAGCQIGGWASGGASTSISAWGLMGSSTQVADASSSAIADDRGLALRQVSGAVSGNSARISAGFIKGHFGAFGLLVYQFALVQITDCRFWGVLTNNTVNTLAQDAGSSQLFGLRFSTGVPDTNFQFCTRGPTSFTAIDTGVPGDTNPHCLLAYQTPVGVFFELYDANFKLEAQAFTAADRPAAGVSANFLHSVTTLTAAAKSLDQFAALMAWNPGA